jgi:hypothetical protein
VDDVAKISEVYALSIFTVHPEDGGSMYLRNFGNRPCPHAVTTKEYHMMVTVENGMKPGFYKWNQIKLLLLLPLCPLLPLGA